MPTQRMPMIAASTFMMTPAVMMSTRRRTTSRVLVGLGA
jgi:hypothetical protein